MSLQVFKHCFHKLCQGQCKNQTLQTCRRRIMLILNFHHMHAVALVEAYIKIMQLWFHLTISRSGNITNLTDLFTHFQVLGDEQHPHTKQSDQLAHHGIYHCEFCPRITLHTSDREFFHELKTHFLNVFSASWTQFVLVINSIKN